MAGSPHYVGFHGDRFKKPALLGYSVAPTKGGNLQDPEEPALQGGEGVRESQLPPLVPYVKLSIRLSENGLPCKEVTPRLVENFFFNIIIKPYLEVVGVPDEERTKTEEAWSQALKRVIERSEKEFLWIPKGFIHFGKESHVTWGPNFYFVDWYFVATLYLPFDEEILEKYFDLVRRIAQQTYLPPLTAQEVLAECGEVDASIKLCNEELASNWLSTKVHSILPPHKDP